MLLQVENGGTTQPLSLNRSLLDSPTLARVERAILRNGNEPGLKDPYFVHRATYTQSLLSPCYNSKDAYSALKRGLLWQQRDKFFSRWKERYFILTKDYLHCFRRASGTDRISEMGQFLFKIKLVDIDRVLWENRKNYSTVALVFLSSMGRTDGKIFLRASEGLEDWFELLEACAISSKERRKDFRTIGVLDSHVAYQNRNNIMNDNNNDDNCSMLSSGDWHMMTSDRQKLPMVGRLPSVRCDGDGDGDNNSVVLRRRHHYPSVEREQEKNDNNHLDHRLSLLTDIDINSCNSDDTLTSQSVMSYRLNHDVLCIQPPSIRDSYRSHNQQRQQEELQQCKQLQQRQQREANAQIKFRERSYSDIQRVDKSIWKPRYNFI